MTLGVRADSENISFDALDLIELKYWIIFSPSVGSLNIFGKILYRIQMIL